MFARTLVALLLSGLSMGQTPAAHAETLVATAPGFVALDITVVETDTNTEIRVQGSEIPTYSVYTIRSPDRVFVDVSNASAVAEPLSLAVDNGVIDSVQVGPFQDGQSSLSRIVVTLESAAYFDVTSDGNTIVILVDGAERNLNPAGTLVLSTAPVDDSAALEARLRGLEAELQAVDSARRASADADRASNDLQAELDERDRRIAELERERQAVLSVTQEETERQRLRLQQLEASVQEREQELAVARARAELANAPSTDTAAAARVADLEAQLSATQEQAREEARLQQQLAAEAAAAVEQERARADRAEAEAAAQAETLQELEQELAAAEAARDEAAREVAERDAALQSARDQSNENDTDSAEIVGLEAQLREAQERSASLQRQTDEIQSLRSRISELEATAAELDAVRDELARLQQAQAQPAATESNREAALEAEVQRLNAELEAERQRAQSGVAASPPPATTPAPALLRNQVSGAGLPMEDSRPIPVLVVPAQTVSEPQASATPSAESSSHEQEPVAGRERRRRNSAPTRCRMVGSSGNQWVPCPR
jgi:hypothetical protein